MFPPIGMEWFKIRQISRYLINESLTYDSKKDEMLYYFDVQAGHSFETAEKNYGKDNQFGIGKSMKEKFYQISNKYHQIIGKYLLLLLLLFIIISRVN